MKYCRKCGMLLEDTQDRCISCGLDVSNEENYSLYPLDIEKNLENTKKSEKKKKSVIGLIVIVLVLLICLIGVFIFMAPNMNLSMSAPQDTDETVAESEDAVASDEEQEMTVSDEESDIEQALSEGEEAEGGLGATMGEASENLEGEEVAGKPSKKINDGIGDYYKYALVSDDAGNEIFHAVYPEDFDVINENVSYAKCSTKFPEQLVYIVGNNDNTARFTYMSPQQFWHKKSETGKSINNERDTLNCMSYLTYQDGKTYVETLLKESYKDAKKVTFKEEVNVNEALTEKLKAFCDSHKKTLLKDIGDYAHIGADTTYATMEAECSGNIYKYEITMKDNSVIYCQFYVPVIANNFYYSSDIYNDRGTVIEWNVLGLYGFEAGNLDMYKELEPMFLVFMENTSVNKFFYYVNYMFGKEMEEAISNEKLAPQLIKSKLADYKNSYNEGDSLGEFYDGVLEVSKLPKLATKSFADDSGTFYVPEDTLLTYYNKTKNLYFVTPKDTEYPGDDYTELK